MGEGLLGGLLGRRGIDEAAGLPAPQRRVALRARVFSAAEEAVLLVVSGLVAN